MLIERLRRWEFWPPCMFYAPVVPWVLLLGARYGFGAIAAANPGMPDGGFVGESKFDILARLPARWVLPSSRVPPGPPEWRTATLRSTLARRGWTFPIILKPDVGERGVGVRLVRTIDEARRYLGEYRAAVIAQVYHAGPHEAGIFYYRLPWEARGRIFSITDKHFPHVVGDGRSTLAELVLHHPRYRMQNAVFRGRHRAEWSRVLAAGERFRLAISGNHAQGTEFRDGAHLLTPALQRRIDEISRTFGGFYLGRYDVRYSDLERFRAGEELAIVELNGVTSESTNIYDASWSLGRAYAVLMQQWWLVFRIGAYNRRQGSVDVKGRRVFALAMRHVFNREPVPAAD